MWKFKFAKLRSHPPRNVFPFSSLTSRKTISTTLRGSCASRTCHERLRQAEFFHVTTCLAVTKMDKQDTLRLRTSMGKSSKTISCHILPFIIPEPVSGRRTDYWFPRVLTLNLKLQLFSTLSIGINLYIGNQCIVVPGRLGNPPRNIPSPFEWFYFRIRQKETPLIPPTAFSRTSPPKKGTPFPW